MCQLLTRLLLRVALGSAVERGRVEWSVYLAQCVCSVSCLCVCVCSVCLLFVSCLCLCTCVCVSVCLCVFVSVPLCVWHVGCDTREKMRCRGGGYGKGKKISIEGEQRWASGALGNGETRLGKERRGDETREGGRRRRSCGLVRRERLPFPCVFCVSACPLVPLSWCVSSPFSV